MTYHTELIGPGDDWAIEDECGKVTRSQHKGDYCG